MDLDEREKEATDHAKWLADWDARHEARERDRRSDFRWLIVHCVMLTLAVGAMLIKLAQDLR